MGQFGAHIHSRIGLSVLQFAQNRPADRFNDCFKPGVGLADHAIEPRTHLLMTAIGVCANFSESFLEYTLDFRLKARLGLLCAFKALSQRSDLLVRLRSRGALGGDLVA